MKRHQMSVLEFMDGLERGLVLDAGSGTDAIGSALKEAGFRVVALDLYEATTMQGRFVRADLNENLPFIGDAFDYVLCSESLQYLENHAKLFREFTRLVKKGGSLILSLPNILNASSRLYFLRRGYYPGFKPIRTIVEKKGWDKVVFNAVSLVEIMGLGVRAGFELKEIKASGYKRSAYLLYPLLKASYCMGGMGRALETEKDSAKASLLRVLSSKDALLGDHLVVRLERMGR
ncbi:MAG: class I SAM-dependent methyltransferase [Deltaproteobacteria bacterium]|nr:class I SAM-dependent methyltransferase [Deltaproteobacteria bacterium]